MIRSLILSVSLIFTLVAQAQEPEVQKTKTDTNREVIRTYAQIYMAEQDYAHTETMISDYLIQDEGDGSLWMMLGQSQVNEKKLAQACYSFQKASTVFKDTESRVFSLYLFADCLNRGGRTDEAIKVLHEIAKIDGSVSQSARTTLELFQKGTLHAGQALPEYEKPMRGQLRVSAALSTGFDTNVLLVEEDVASGFPISNRGSFFVTPAAQVGYLGKVWGGDYDSRYIVSFTDYLNSNAKSYNALYQRGDFIWGSGDQRWGAFGDLLFMNRNPFQVYDWTGGMSWILNHRLDSKHAWDFEVPVRYQKFPGDPATGAVNDRTGEGITFKARYRSAKSGVENWGVQAALDQQFSKGNNYKLTALNIPAFMTTLLPYFKDLKLVNSFNAEVVSQYYWAASPSRRDLTFRVGTGVTRSFGGGWNANLNYLYTKNLSTVLAARYTKEIISLTMSKDFL